MKYTLYSASQYTLVGKTDDAVKALEMARLYEIRNSTDDVTISCEDGSILDSDALWIFVDGLMEYPSDKISPITLEEAAVNLTEYRKNMDDVPAQMTPEILCYIWNQMVEDAEEEDIPEPVKQKLLAVLLNKSTHCVFTLMMWPDQADKYLGDMGNHIQLLSIVPVSDPDAFIHSEIDDFTSARYN